MTFLLMFLGLLALVLINVPIAIALGVVAAVAMVLSSGSVPFPTWGSSCSTAPPSSR